MRYSTLAFAVIFPLMGNPSSAHAVEAASPFIQKARAIIAKRMVDPESLQVRSTRLVTVQRDGKARQVLCGQFNAKNRMGGYVGFKGFAYEPSDMKGVLTFEVNFYAENGVDFSKDPTEALRAGISADILEGQADRYFGFAKAYFPACLGSDD
jgi:hypothetical protein